MLSAQLGEQFMKSLVLAIAAVAALAPVCAASAQEAPYQSKRDGGGVGYAQQKLDDNRWLVKYAGDRDTPAETVETYLLFRAAELTIKKGGDWFETSDSRTALKTVVPDRVRPESKVGLDYGWGWRPHWRFFNVDHVVKSDTGISGKASVPIRGPSHPASKRFVASAEITIGKGPAPEGRRVFDARKLQAELGPSIQRVGHAEAELEPNNPHAGRAEPSS
jgi:hypothetical protein